MRVGVEEPNAHVGDAAWLPHVDMQFDTEGGAYEFYNKYAEIVGFSVRKSKMWTTSKDVVAARTFVCSRQGFRQKKKGFEPKKPRPATRIGCPACMTIKITPNGRYHATEFVPDHNHPPTTHMLRSHRAKARAKAAEADPADDLGIPPNRTHDLRLKRLKAMPVGDAGAVLEYLQKMQADSPSFFYAVRVDGDDKLTNFFWTDAKSVMDYKYFGDVVCFDTIYKATDCGKPFALFNGVNNHKQMIIFGSALLYDEGIESFKWLFETFKSAMHGKPPKTVLTDCCTEISDAISAVWPGTTQRLCLWHMYQNATKHLNQVFEGSKTFACDFSQCLFDFEEEEEFLLAWTMLIEKYDLNDNEWLANMFQDRERWALPYGRQTFCADMQSTLQKESLNSVLKKCLSQQQDFLLCFEHYDRVLEERRCAELQADVRANQSTLKVPSLRMLRQAANAYTPAVFKMFQKEFEMHMDCMVYSCGEEGTTSEYKVTIEEKPKEYFVRFDSLDDTVSCTCKKFEFVGIQCRHVLKVLDFRNIKALPPQYILKRWRQDAKFGTVEDHHEYTFDSGPKYRYNDLCCTFNTIAARAAKSVESYTFVESQSDLLMEELEQILQRRPLDVLPTNLIGSIVESLHHDNSPETNFVGILGF